MQREIENQKEGAGKLTILKEKQKYMAHYQITDIIKKDDKQEVWAL